LAEPIEMPFEGLTHVGPRIYVTDGVQDQTKPYAAAISDKTTMWPFVKLLQTLVF